MMKMIEDIILEQGSDYSNWNTTKPSDYSTSKYELKIENKNGVLIRSYKLKTASGTSLSDYVGKFKTDTTPSVTVEISIEDGKLIFDYSVVKEELTPSNEEDTFTLTYLRKNYTIKFNRSSDNKVNGFSGEIFGKTVTATKEGTSNNSSTSGTAGTSGSSGSAGTSGSAGSSGTTTVIKKEYTKYDPITPEDRIKGFKWHDCENKDFPYEFGCKNKNLGQMNMCLFGSDLNGIFGKDLWEKITDMAFSGDKKEITKEMYDAVMLDCKKQEESVEIKKIIKENTYKILKQLK